MAFVRSEKNIMAQTQGDGTGWQPDLPTMLRAPSLDHVKERPEDYAALGLLKLATGHTINPTEICVNQIQGTIRAHYFYEINPDERRPAGEWALVDKCELKAALPSVCLEWNFGRASYWVNIIRDAAEKVSEVRVYSRSYLPIFRLSLLLPIPAQELRRNTASWWTLKPGTNY